MCWAMGDHENGVGLADHPVCNLYLPSLPVGHSCSHGSHTKSSIVWVVQLPARGKRFDLFGYLSSSFLHWRLGLFIISWDIEYEVQDAHKRLLSIFVLTCILPPFYGHTLQHHQSTAGKLAPHLTCSTSSAGRCECRPKLALFSLCTPCRFLPPEDNNKIKRKIFKNMEDRALVRETGKKKTNLEIAL